MQEYSVMFVDKNSNVHEFKFVNLECAIDYAFDVNKYASRCAYVFKHGELLYRVSDGVLTLAKDF